MKDQVTVKDMQVGGSHYKDMAIQPVEFITKNNIGYCEGNVIKYVCRWKNKNGVEDLKKARHYIDLLIDAVSSEKDTTDDFDFIAELEKHNVHLSRRFDEKGARLTVKIKDQIVFDEALFQEVLAHYIDITIFTHKVRLVGKHLVNAGVAEQAVFIVLAMCLGCFTFRGPIDEGRYAYLTKDIFTVLDDYCGETLFTDKRDVTQALTLMTKNEMHGKFISIDYNKVEGLTYRAVWDTDKDIKSEKLAVFNEEAAK